MSDNNITPSSQNPLESFSFGDLLRSVFGDTPFGKFLQSFLAGAQEGTDMSIDSSENVVDFEWNDEIPIELRGSIGHARGVVRTRGRLNAQSKLNGGLFRRSYNPNPPKKPNNGK